MIDLVGHVDLDAFFASAAKVADPSLDGLAVAIGSDGPHGVVATASYEARKFGVRSAMRMTQAKEMCPQLRVVAPDFSWYRELSFEVLAAAAELSTTVAPAGIDEAYLKFPGGVTWDNIKEIGEDLRSRILARTSLVASFGAGQSRGVAKLASDAAKPDGLLIVTPEETTTFLRSRKLRELGGAGPATMARLDDLGIYSVQALAEMTESAVRGALGTGGVGLWLLANGKDGTEVTPHGAQSSVGAEETLDSFISDFSSFREEVARMAREALDRLENQGRGARGVTLKARGSDFVDVTRATSLGAPTNDERVVMHALGGLIEPTWAVLNGRVRLVGVTLTGLSDVVQPRLRLGVREPREWKLGRAPRTGEIVEHAQFGRGEVVVGDSDTGVVRFSDRVRVIKDPRAHLTRVEAAGA